MFKLLGAVIYCVLNKRIFLDYTFLQKYTKLVSFHNGYEDGFFIPTLTTFADTIKKGNFIGWPGIDSTTILLCIQDPTTTAKGHLAPKNKNL